MKKSSEEMFSLVEKSIASQPDLEVILVSRIPRVASVQSDPIQVKSKLSQYGNSIYHNLWMDRGCPTNIKIHDLGMDCYGQLKDKRYGIPGTRGFDGKFVDMIHMRGHLAVKHYLDSFIRMLRPVAADISPGRSQMRSESDDHTNCEQAVHEQRSWAQYHRSNGRSNTEYQGGYRAQTGRGFSRNNRNNNSKQSGYHYKEKVDRYEDNIYNVPVNNRFSKNY